MQKKIILFGINKIFTKIFISFNFLLIAQLFFCSNISAQNNDLEAQFSYKQAEDALAKDDFSSSVTYCEKAVSQLGKTNQKILSLQFQAYSGQLKKDCTNPLLSDKNKIDSYLKYYFDNFSSTADQNKVFEVMKFRDDWNNFKNNGCKEPTYLTMYDIGLIDIAADESGLMGTLIYTYIDDKNIFSISDPKYIKNVSVAVSSYSINGKTTITSATYETRYTQSYNEQFNKDLKDAQRSGAEKITVSLDVCIIKGLSNRKTNCTTITGSILNPLNK